MIRMVLEIDNDEDILTNKEVIAMALESVGNVRVVSITTDGRDKR